jgi:hypothetical protein
MAPHEAAEHIEPIALTCQYRLAIQMALHISAESRHSCIPLGGFLTHCPADDGIEVSRELPRRHDRKRDTGSYPTCHGRNLVQNLFQRNCIRNVAEVPRRTICQQREQQHAQCIDVCRRIDRGLRELLRCGVR